LDDVDVGLIEYAPLCDAPLRSPVSIDDKTIEARTARLLPGLGQLPLTDLLAHLPANITLAVEAPTVALLDLPFNEQARIVRDQTIRFLRDCVS
jgi:nucleoid-associated protein YgaU